MSEATMSKEENAPLLEAPAVFISSDEKSDEEELFSQSGSDNSSSQHAPDRADGTSNFGTIMHIIKGNMGTGILAMPLAFANAGILVGTLGMLILGVICVHCMHVLVRCSHYLCAKLNRTSMDYADVAEVACAEGPAPLARHSKKVRNTVNTFLFITQFGFCCVYVLFIAQNVKLIIQKLTKDPDEPATLKPDYPMNTQLFELCLVALLIPFVLIKSMKHLAPFSFVANVATLCGLLVLLYYICFRQKLNSISRLPLFNSWSTLPLYLGTAIYAFEGIGVILPVENAMREPRALPSTFGVLNLAMTIVCVLYITVGFYGYLEFGTNAQGSVTLNVGSWYGIVVQVLFSIAIFVSYGIQFYVPMTVLSPALARTRLAQLIGPWKLDFLCRAALVICTFAVAAIVDEYLDLLISLIGSLASSALALIFPGLIEIVTFWRDRHTIRGFWVMFAKDVAIATFGVICFFFGTIFALIELVDKIGHPQSGNT